MKFRYYVKDGLFSILLFGIMYLMILLVLFIFKLPNALIIYITLLHITFGISILLFNYFRKKKFYDEFLSNLDRLDKKYLILETIQPPTFYEGDIMVQSLYDINKSMMEKIKNYQLSIDDFKDYIEMWIHEVKIPLSSLILMSHNHKDKFDKKAMEQINRLENYVEQVLYYVRSENAQKDYLINKCSLNDIIAKVAMKNRTDLLENKIELTVLGVDHMVLTDSKWQEFILNQIINNSIKYCKGKKDSFIKIETHTKEKGITVLSIFDNGIGIQKSDLGRVFEKSFTGINGRTKSKSTGMGLYIVNKLCNKLGHGITIESVEGEYTKVSILFSQSNYYEVLK